MEKKVNKWKLGVYRGLETQTGLCGMFYYGYEKTLNPKP